jgi:tyrosine-protein phosphatase SIW14
MSTFYQVDAEVWRGPRPEAADIPLVLSKFKSVLDLEGIDEDIQEQNELVSLRVLAGDISDWEIYSPVLGFTLVKLNNILDALSLAPKPCLVHCLHGQDRTGIVIAAYQVRRGWTKEAAMAEAKKYGYRQYINFGLNRVWKQFKQKEK